MKTLQNNFTTPEQSKRLLELGVPADSADCYLDGNSVIMLNNETFQENYDEDLELARLHLIEYPHYIPCWSVGRLIKICLKCSTLEQRQVRFFCNGDDDEYSIIDFVINVLESGIMTNHNDFSKLEE